jgi:hypothetical protein
MLGRRSRKIAFFPEAAPGPSGALLLMSTMLVLLAVSALAQDVQRSFLTYMYAPATEVTGRYGPPASTHRMANGDTVLTYEWPRTETNGGYTVSNAEPMYPTGLPDGPPYSGNPLGIARRYIPTQTVEAPCEVRFTVGTDGQVRGIGWVGEGCLID